MPKQPVINHPLIIGLLILLSSCQNQTKEFPKRPAATTHITTNQKVKSTSLNYQASDNEGVKGKALAIKNMTNHLKQVRLEKPELRPVIDKVLSQSEKFSSLVEMCSISNSSGKLYQPQNHFISFFKLSGDKYLLHLQCFTGAYQPGGVYFLFSTVTGIQTQPLRFTKLSGYESNRPKEVPITDRDSPVIVSYPQFDPAKRELILLHRCDGQWRCFSQSRYTLIKDQMVLQEYVIGSRNLDTKDKRYRTYQLIRDGDRWISSGIMLCEQRDLAACLK